MNYKEAKEYLNSLPKPCIVTVDSEKYKSAICHGYLEALRGEEVRILVEALEEFSKYKKFKYDEEHGSWGNADDSYSHGSDVADSYTGEKAREALAKFKSVTGEK